MEFHRFMNSDENETFQGIQNTVIETLKNAEENLKTTQGKVEEIVNFSTPLQNNQVVTLQNSTIYESIEDEKKNIESELIKTLRQVKIKDNLLATQEHISLNLLSQLEETKKQQKEAINAHEKDIKELKKKIQEAQELTKMMDDIRQRREYWGEMVEARGYSDAQLEEMLKTATNKFKVEREELKKLVDNYFTVKMRDLLANLSEAAFALTGDGYVDLRNDAPCPLEVLQLREAGIVITHPYDDRKIRLTIID